MKLGIIVLLGLLLLTNGQYQKGSPQRGSPSRGPPPPTHRYPPSNAHPSDNHNVGMRYQSPPASESDEMISGMIGFFLEQLKDVHIDEYETEDGTFNNVNIHVKSPSKDNILFRYNENDESLQFGIKGVGVEVDTDMNLYYGALKGHTKLDIKGLDMDLSTTPSTLNGEKAAQIHYHLHLKDADITADITAAQDLSQLPEEVGLDFMPLFGNLETTFKIATTDMIDQAFEERTQQIINEYFGQMSTEYNIPKNLGHKVKTNQKITFDALPFRVGETFNSDENKVMKSIIVDFDTNSIKSSNSVRENLNSNIKDQRYNYNDILNIKSELHNPDKHHVLIAPQVLSGLIHNFDTDFVSFKIEDQTELQKKVRDYFGNDIALECSSHEGEFPEYKSNNDAISGEQTVKCVLHPRGQKFEPLYEVDLKLNFNIHPKVGKDGKSLTAEFGTIQATSINTHDKKMEVKASISDKMDEDTYAQMDPFGNDMLIPFLMNAQLDTSRTDSYHTQNIAKFKNLLNTPNLLDISKLEKNLFG